MSRVSLMDNPNTKIDSWLMAVSSEQDNNEDIWEAGFEVDRQIVHSKFGPYKKLFLRPDNFVKRFYHTVYPLSVEEWQSIEQVELYDGFCTIDIVLDVRFQATVNYAMNHAEILSEINEHIKNSYHDLVFDFVHKELLNLSDGAWVQTGLQPAEKKIAVSINEMLIVKDIQSEVVCQLKPSFKQFPDVEFAKENVYLSVLKKSFQFNEQEREEVFRQQQEREKQKIKHKRAQLQQINEIAEIDRQKQTLLAENTKLLLEEKTKQQQQQFEIKKKMHADKIEQSSQLKEMALIVELKENERQQALLREQEQQEKVELIEHQSILKEKELEANIAEYEVEQASWRMAKDKIHKEELDLKHKQKQLEFDADVGYKKRYELQRLAMQEESYTARKKADVYLKREIELLELEKQRLALQMTIKESKEKKID